MTFYMILLLHCFLEMEKYIMGCRIFSDETIKNKWLMIAGAIVYVLCVKTWNLTDDSIDIVRIFTAVIIVTLCMDTKVGKRVSIMFILVFSITCIDQIFSVIIDIFLKNDIWEYQDLLEELLMSSCTCIVLLFLYMLKNKYGKVFPNISNNIIYFVIGLMGSTMLFTIAGLQFAEENMRNEKFTFICRILVPITSGCVGILGGVVIYIRKLNNRLKESLDMERILYQTQKNYYEILQGKEEDTRAFRHDMANHTICLHSLLEDNKRKQALIYVENMQTQIKKIQDKCYQTGNGIIDAILNYYLPILDPKTEIQVEGRCTSQLIISDVELCVIIANLVQNASEAILREGEEKSFLNIFIRTGKEDFYFKITNTTTDMRFIGKNELPKSVKRGGNNHGIGLKNVQETVQKNQGIFEVKIEDRIFEAEVILPLDNNRLRG